MPDDIDINNGKASFASAREDAWHQLGTVLPDSFTAEQAMDAALLGGWNVRKAPLQANDPDTLEQVQIPGHVGVLRDNPGIKGQVDPLGVVGANYEIVQNEEHAAFLNTLVDESGAHFETAGALHGGRRVFLTMKMPEAIQVGGVDPVDQYLAAINSHDGSMSFTLLVTPVRVVCQNTLNLALAGAKNQFRVKHSKGIRENIGEARRALELSFKYLDEFQDEAEELINTELTNDQFRSIIEKEFGASDSAPAATQTRSEARLDKMMELFEQANTQEGIRNTAWAGFNAITEYGDHWVPTRGDNADVNRALRAALSPTFTTRALKAVTA